MRRRCELERHTLNRNDETKRLAYCSRRTLQRVLSLIMSMYAWVCVNEWKWCELRKTPVYESWADQTALPVQRETLTSIRRKYMDAHAREKQGRLASIWKQTQVATCVINSSHGIRKIMMMCQLGEQLEGRPGVYRESWQKELAIGWKTKQAKT